MADEARSASNGDSCLAAGTVAVRHVVAPWSVRPTAPRFMARQQVSFTRLHPHASVPAIAHPGDAAFDLATIDHVSLVPGERAAVPTGLAVAIPEGWAGLVLPRSGHALRHGLGVVNGPGLIDAGYRGEVRVILINHGDEEIAFEPGDRIAQLLILPVPEVELIEVDELPPSRRGSGGFGSTGR